MEQTPLEYWTSVLGPDLGFWVSYLTNGKHLAFYSSVQYTLIAALAGGLFTLLFGLLGAGARLSRFRVLRGVGLIYTNMVRGIPDVLFILFFPLAFEQGVEWLRAQYVCSAADIAANAGQWPPCDSANWLLGTPEYLALASVTLGLVYGAFAANVIAGAMRAIPPGQIEAARAYGFSAAQVFWRFRVRQMWAYALPGLSNVWMLLVKATSLLSLLQIADMVLWANRLGSPNFSRSAGVVHGDWRWGYYLVLLVFYILLTWLSEKVFAALNRRASRGMAIMGRA